MQWSVALSSVVYDGGNLKLWMSSLFVFLTIVQVFFQTCEIHICVSDISVI